MHGIVVDDEEWELAMERRPHSGLASGFFFFATCFWLSDVEELARFGLDL